MPESAAPERPLRADARRNRDRLLEVAARRFAAGGADVPLEAVAKEAGVGIGTLYRHFPTREALVDAAYRHELARVGEAAGELLGEHAPDVALRAWMDRFTDYMATKHGMADALAAVVASGGDPYGSSKAVLGDAVGALVAAGVEAGSLRADAHAEDVVVALIALCRSASADEQRDRLLDLLVDGLRAR